jgi:hypothetical protein
MSNAYQVDTAAAAIAATAFGPETLAPMPAAVYLKREELMRWRFNGLMDFKKPARSPTECIAYWQPLIIQALDILKERRAASTTLPGAITIVFATGQETKAEKMAQLERAREAGRHRQAVLDAIFAQEQHIFKLRSRYSYELAHALWYMREAAQEARKEAVRERYHATWTAELEEQNVFEEEQVATAMEQLREKQPHLAEETLKRLSRLLKLKMGETHIYHTKRLDTPRRLMRGLPLVRYGRLPSQAHLDYAPEDRNILSHAL